ncbi:hypothetical protein A1F94_013764 [Pyrenophora tritici-repentis]|nr:hypothetical protein A1F94_013764 [Pyrenophora tritici-repentis]
MPGDDKDKATVAVFVEQKEEEVSDGDGSSARVFFPSQVDSQLSERLPSYDRKRLRDWGYILSPAAGGAAHAQPGTKAAAVDRQEAMQQLWAQVLNIDADSIGLDDSFFRLGGDSITAMQVSSTARSLQISVTTADILEQKTISRLAHRMSRNHFSSILSYISGSSTGSACFDQSFPRAQQLDKPRIAARSVQNLVRRHSMLSFVQPDGWSSFFAIAFSDRAPPTIFNESHGREPWDAGIDLSRTVGWFTSMLPIQVPSHTRGDLLEVIRHTKDGMRKFDNDPILPRVIFNYQGVYQLERTDSLFKTLPAPDGCEPASMLEAPSKAKRQQQVANWIERYEMALVEMATPAEEA